MLRTIMLLAVIAISFFARSQDPVITWGDEFKITRGSGTQVKVLTADPSGVYLVEKGFVTPTIISARLVKLDNNLHEVFNRIYTKDHKGKEFETFFAFKNKVLLIASTYHSKERSLEVFAAEVNGSSGDLTEWKTIANIQKEERNQDIAFKLMPNADTSGFVVFSATANKEKYRYQVQAFDKNLAATTQPVTIANEFEVKTYTLEDILFTADSKIVLVGKVILYPEGKRKAAHDPEIANYHIRIYDEHGSQVSEVNTNINGRWLINARVMLTKNKELILAGFYSNSRKIVADGLMILRIDPSTGQVIGAVEKEINYSMITTDNDNDGNEDKPGAGFSKYMTFRNIFHTADGGLVLLAENYKDDVERVLPGWNFKGPGGDLKNNYFDSDEIMMCKIDAGNTVSWLHVLPKTQRERIPKALTDPWGILRSSAFFYESNVPYYSGFGAMQHDGKIDIFFNDNPENANVVQPGQKVFTAKSMWQTRCYRVTLDEVTGKYQRNDFFDNKEVPTPMIRYGKVIGYEMYIVGKTPDYRMGKIKLSVAKITLQ
jgi:hypothetical protein